MKPYAKNSLMIIAALMFLCAFTACGRYKRCDQAAETPCKEGKTCVDIGLRSTVCLDECEAGAAEPGCGRNEACFRFAVGQSACMPTCSDEKFRLRCPEGWLCAAVAGDESICRPACDPATSNADCAAGQYCMGLGDGTGVCMPGGCDPYSGEGCGAGQSCELGPGGIYSCQAAVYIEGRVFDSADSALGIAGAHVTASDKTGAVATDVAITGDNGTYKLQVPVPRSDEGTLTDGTFTLRGEANNYQPYPSGIRPSIPVDATQAALQQDGTYVLKNASTAIALIELPASEQGRKFISGSIDRLADNSTRPGGALIVAEGGPCALTCPFSFSDKQGNFTIFNVPAGSWTIRGYKEFLQLDPVSVTHDNETDLTNVMLTENEKPYGTVSGNVNIVNPGLGDNTTVVLVPESTFSSTFVKGEVPPGLRAPKPPAQANIRNEFTITGVPDGIYRVLAAFENDNLTRDPDTTQGGTAIVTITVPDNASYDIEAGAFKVTGSLQIFSPGASTPDRIDDTGALQLIWADDSGEQTYTLIVYNALGEEVCRNETIPKVSGSSTVTKSYSDVCDSSQLQPGMYYQFKVISKDGSDVPLSQTEDLLGVFYVP